MHKRVFVDRFGVSINIINMVVNKLVAVSINTHVYAIVWNNLFIETNRNIRLDRFWKIFLVLVIYQQQWHLSTTMFFRLLYAIYKFLTLCILCLVVKVQNIKQCNSFWQAHLIIFKCIEWCALQKKNRPFQRIQLPSLWQAPVW